MEMEKEKLFAIAIFAVKPDPEHTVSVREDGFAIHWQDNYAFTENYFNMPIAYEPDYELAVSKEAAEEVGLRHAKELYPESEGWTAHQARAEEINGGDILEAAAYLILETKRRIDEEGEHDARK